MFSMRFEVRLLQAASLPFELFTLSTELFLLGDDIHLIVLNCGTRQQPPRNLITFLYSYKYHYFVS